jgi:hypothetical protein
MITLKRFSLNLVAPLLAAGLLVQGDALAATTPDDAQALARRLLVAPAAAAATPGTRLDARVAAATADAARDARGLILNRPSRVELPLKAQPLQARATSVEASRTAGTGGQDAQAQARRLIHGGAA